MRRPALLLLVLACSSLAACARGRPPPRSNAWGPPGGGRPGYQAPFTGARSPGGASIYTGPTAQAPRPAGQQSFLLGPAVTSFGPLFQSLPQLPLQLPPLPGLPALGDWANVPLALPFPFPGVTAPVGGGGTDGWPAEWTGFEDEVLRLTNERRAVGANCGGQMMGPAAPVSTLPALRTSARGHSRDMATRDYFDHTSPEGKGPSNRAVEAGYQGSFVGENIAAGQPDPGRVVQAWLDSPGHCLNLMDPRYRVLGVGYFFEQNDNFGHFWTQNFGS